VTRPAGETRTAVETLGEPLALIIKDDDKLSIIYSGALRQAEFVTRAIHDGVEALAQLPTSQSAAIVLDLHLPHTSSNKILWQFVKRKAWCCHGRSSPRPLRLQPKHCVSKAI
jgi:ActR/RegA family two-component response regulator